MLRPLSLKWHNWFGWTGGAALALFALSGLLHILMTWTGPQAASFFPPQTSFSAEMIQAVPRVLAQNQITRAHVVRIVPAQAGPLLQVTISGSAPRRYFDLTSGMEIIGHDTAQAIWLARYYSGEQVAPVRRVTYQTSFDGAYPWVNRLLPVYRVTFETDDNLTAFVHTEFGALGNLTNDWKSGVQSAFAILHTWSWLDDLEGARLILMLVLLLSLLALAVTGTAMVFLLKNRTMPAKRRWHRLIAYGTWLPILFFTVSGTYHLFQMSLAEREQALVLGAEIDLTASRLGTNAEWATAFSDTQVNGVAVVEAPDGSLVYRVSLPQGRHGQSMGRAARYRGQPLEASALYISSLSGDPLPLGDREMAEHLAAQFTGRAQESIEAAQLVTHFGADYDFRNKRLPVWRVDYADERIFIDTTSGVQVDRVSDCALVEAYTFSILHKWNLLVPLIGRLSRDLLLLAVLIPALIAGGIGFVLLIQGQWQRQRQRQRRAQQTARRPGPPQS